MNSLCTQELDIAWHAEDAKLHKIFLLVPNVSSHVKAQEPQALRFHDTFIHHLKEVITEQPVMFEEDAPRDAHRRVGMNAALLVLMIPSHFIISLDGRLTLQHEKITPAHIQGAYLSHENDEFLPHEGFDFAA